jgi:hypothetical protein
MTKTNVLFGGNALNAVKNKDGSYSLDVSGPGGINYKLRDACEVYPNDDVWEAVIASGSFITPRGNTAGAGWVEVNMSPWFPDVETVIGFRQTFEMPSRVFGMVTLSHRNAGQQVASINIESEDVLAGLEPMPDTVPIEILNASQATTTITVNFTAPPAVPLRIGQVISIEGFADTRLNVSNATVATTPSDTQITLVGNDYAFTSTTIASTPGNGAAFIERREMLGNARNAVGVVHGSATATQRRVYTRSQGGVSRPSGTVAGSHHVTTGTDVATAAASAPRADAWVPSSEFSMLVSRDHVTYLDRGVDANAAWSPRYRQTQVTPNPERSYKTKVRVRSTPGLTRPVAKIASISKAGSTTATVTTDGPHGLVTGQYVGFYGVRDQAAFANQTTGLLCTVTGENTFTVAHGSSATATSYGGFVVLVQGQQALGGAVAQVAQSVTRVNGIVTITGNATWAAPAAIGNVVELIGCRDAVSGADLGLDGVYNVINLATTTLTLEPVLNVAGSPSSGDDIGATNCGGAVVQRFAVRLHVLMVVDYDPMLIEFAFKGNPDAGEAIVVQGAVTATMTSTGVAGTVAQDAAIGNPVTAGVRASSANVAAMSASGDSVAWLGTMIGVGVVKPYCLPEAEWNASLALTGTGDVAIQPAGGAGLKRHVTSFWAINTGASLVDLIIKDGSTVRKTYPLPVNVPVPVPLPTGIILTANTALNAALGASGTVRFNATGYTAP